MTPPDRKPTTHDFLMLLEWAGAEASACAGLHYDDRSRTAFCEAQKRLEEMHKTILYITGLYPQSDRKGKWVKWAIERNNQHKGAY